MVETITPVVYGGRRGKWLVGVALLVLGSTLSAALFGAGLGFIGRVLGAPWGVAAAVTVALIGIAYAAREFTGLKVPVLQARRQVPEWWRTFFSPYTAALLYGVGLGIGFFTYLTYGTLVVVSALALATGSPLLGLAFLAPFGLARGLTVLVAARAESGEAANRLVTRLADMGRSGAIRVVNGAAALAVAIAVLLAAASTASKDSDELGTFAAAVIALAFGWAAAVKLAAPGRWRDALTGYGLPAGVRRAVSIAVPLLEALVVLLVVVGQLRVACALAAGLLVLFSLALVRAVRLRGPKVDCGCFGGRGRLDYRVLMLRNAVLVIAAALGLALAPVATSPTVAAPSPVPMALTIAGLVAGWWAVQATTRALRGGRA